MPRHSLNRYLTNGGAQKISVFSSKLWLSSIRSRVGALHLDQGDQGESTPYSGLLGKLGLLPETKSTMTVDNIRYFILKFLVSGVLFLKLKKFVFE